MQTLDYIKVFYVVTRNRAIVSDHMHVCAETGPFALQWALNTLMLRYPAWTEIFITTDLIEGEKEHYIKATKKV